MTTAKQGPKRKWFYRMFRLGVDNVKADVPGGGEVKFLAPRDTLKALAAAAGSRAGGEVAIVVNAEGTQAKFVTERFEIVTQLIQGNFPDYRKLIPQTYDVLLNFERARMEQAVRLVGPIAADGSGIVRLVANDMTLEVSAKAGEGKITRALELTSKVGRGMIALDARFLADVVGHKDLVSMELTFTTPQGPMTFRAPADAPGWVELVMPMEVQW